MVSSWMVLKSTVSERKQNLMLDFLNESINTHLLMNEPNSIISKQNITNQRIVSYFSELNQILKYELWKHPNRI